MARKDAGRTARATANGGPVRRARRRWRLAVAALAAAFAALWLARAAWALADGNAAVALGHARTACAFAAGCLAGRLIEGLRHPPRPGRFRGDGRT